jgi:ribosomal protein L37AE/L43A
MHSMPYAPRPKHRFVARTPGEAIPAIDGCAKCGVKGWPHYDRLADGAWVCAECNGRKA